MSECCYSLTIPHDCNVGVIYSRNLWIKVGWPILAWCLYQVSWKSINRFNSYWGRETYGRIHGYVYFFLNYSKVCDFQVSCIAQFLPFNWLSVWYLLSECTIYFTITAHRFYPDSAAQLYRCNEIGLSLIQDMNSVLSTDIYNQHSPNCIFRSQQCLTHQVTLSNIQVLESFPRIVIVTFTCKCYEQTSEFRRLPFIKRMLDVNEMCRNSFIAEPY